MLQWPTWRPPAISRICRGFLDLYYLGASVLRDADDFYALMADYLAVCREQHIVHCEVMVEPQTYEPQGVELGTVLAGFQRAIEEARAGWGQSVGLILSFLRHLPEADALRSLELGAAVPGRLCRDRPRQFRARFSARRDFSACTPRPRRRATR
jgi:adenosine deaminase